MSRRHDIRLTVNGVVYERTVEPRMLLTDFLRHDLGMTGTHVGCEHGVCGACTVLVDGDSARSCLMFAVQADGCTVETVEGLGRIGKLNPLAAVLPRTPRAAMRLLHPRHADDRDGSPEEISARN